MKWLLLILFVSCGQEKMPKAVDLGDNDGDQIPNHLELAQNKYIADFTPVGEINGEMRFLNGKAIKQEVLLKLTNKRDMLNESLDILTRSEQKIVPEDFFSEWSKIKIETPNEISELEDRIHELTLTFLSTNEKPDYLLLISGGKNIKLGDFSSSMQIRLEKKDLKLLLTNQAYLAFGKRTMLQHYADSQPVQQTIKEKTYRVFFN